MVSLIFIEKGRGVDLEVAWVLCVFMKHLDEAFVPFGTIEPKVFLLERIEYTSLSSRNQLFTLQRGDNWNFIFFIL